VYFGIPELAYYKEARDVVVKCLHQAALYEDRYGQGPLMAFVRATPETDQYELLPTPLLERVVMYVRSVQEKQRQLTGQTPTEQAAPSIDTTSVNITLDEGGRLRSAYTRWVRGGAPPGLEWRPCPGQEIAQGRRLFPADGDGCCLRRSPHAHMVARVQPIWVACAARTALSNRPHGGRALGSGGGAGWDVPPQCAATT